MYKMRSNAFHYPKTLWTDGSQKPAAFTVKVSRELNSLYIWTEKSIQYIRAR